MTTDQQTTTTRKFGFPHIILILGLGLLFCVEAYSGYHLHALSTARTQIKEDYSTINNITFGLFSVDQWREKISDVVNGQVQDFDITPQQKRALLVQVEQQLHSLVSKTVASINKPQKTFGGKLKKFAFNHLVKADSIQAQVPSFARTIVNKVTSPASKKRLKGIAMGKINQLENETYDNTDTAATQVTNLIYHKYHVTDPDGFNKKISAELAANKALSYKYFAAMVGCVLIVLLVWWLLKNQYYLKATLFAMSLLFSFVLAAVGITASIIEVDARIKTLYFTLLGQKVSFDNQVLFFQSKSLVGIVQVLIRQPKADAVLVGALILVFVIIFPILRLVFTGIHMLSGKAIADSKVVRYFTFQSGHWAMADVMIVGILMTYIGLNGILESQLSNLNIHNSFLTTITENSTSLQPGYMVFVVFVIFSAVLTTIIKKITPYSVPVRKKHRTANSIAAKKVNQ